MEQPIQSAVSIQNAFKSYGSRDVLKNLCMHVKKGTIYGLLGASGCGKTTLLSCIVGMKYLNSGDIWVLGGRPGSTESGVPGARLGYMPQEIALVGEFTVKDAIYYFGRIFNMTDKCIEERFLTLSKLLDLPPNNRYLKHCSGGQQRRVSFAAAMVHKPELLILDEPTVGVDPVLRERIWDHLIEVTNKENISVIITTHYIEEARQAHAIGLMRDGKLLAEESPSNLLSRFQTDSLEEVFLILSRKQEEGRLARVVHEVDGSNMIEMNDNIQNLNSSTMSFDTNHGSTNILTEVVMKKNKAQGGALSLNKHRIKALMDKNWKQFYRNVGGLIFIVIFPIIEILAFVLAVGANVKGINLAVVNDETTTTLCPNFTLNGTAIPFSFSDCHFHDLSCRFLTYLEDPMINKIKYDNLPDALTAIKKGEVVGALHMAKNFTNSFENRISDGRNVAEEIIDFGQIKVWLDMSNRQIGEEIKYKLYELYLNFQKNLFEDCKYDLKLSEFIKLETVYGEKDAIFTVFMVPGMIMTILFFMGATMTSQIIISDRCEGVWDRSSAAGVSPLEITLTHFSLQACVVFIHIAEVFFVVFTLFKFDYIGNLWIMVLIAYLQGLAGMCYGFWISIISPTHSMANIVTTGSFYPMIVLCGLVWPLEGMPTFLQWISKCLPFTLSIISFRDVMSKGWTLSNWEVLSGIGVEIIWIVTLGVISIYLIKTKR